MKNISNVVAVLINDKPIDYLLFAIRAQLSNDNDKLTADFDFILADKELNDKSKAVIDSIGKYNIFGEVVTYEQALERASKYNDASLQLRDLALNMPCLSMDVMNYYLQ